MRSTSLSAAAGRSGERFAVDSPAGSVAPATSRPLAGPVAAPASGGGSAPAEGEGPSFRRVVAGFGLMILTMLLFSLLDLSAKIATASVPALEVIWFRYTVHLVLVTALLRPWRDPALWRPRRPGLQVTRALMLTLNTSLNFFALQYLQLAQTVTIMFLSPLLIAMLSALFLGERVGPRRWAAIVVGFVGIVVVTRPGFGDVHWAFLLSLGSVACFAVYVMLTRQLGQSETAASLILYSALVPSVILTPAMVPVFEWPSSPGLWGLLLVLGVLGGLGHYLLILAHRHLAANVLAPVTYTQIVWMILFGYLVFGDVPDGFTLLGAAIVITSGIYLLARERVRARERAAARR